MDEEKEIISELDNESDEVEIAEEIVEEIEEIEETELEQDPQTVRIKKKKKARRLLIAIVALLIILIPCAICINNCYEDRVEQMLYEDAVVYSNMMLKSRYETSSNFTFDKEPVKVYYYEKESIFDNNQIVGFDLRAYDDRGNSYICYVTFNNGEIDTNFFENYQE